MVTSTLSPPRVAPWFDQDMSENTVVSASREIAAPAKDVFELIADPSRQPEWDGNDNLASSNSARVRRLGDVFVMTNTSGKIRENHIVAFEEGRLIAWRPSGVGEPQPGHEWRWEVEPIDESSCRVTHTYNWTDLTDENRFERARSTTSDTLMASINRLADLATQ